VLLQIIFKIDSKYAGTPSETCRKLEIARATSPA
jgi:hypothetical protein